MKKELVSLQSVNYLQASPELEELQHLMPISDIDYSNLKKDIEESGEVRDAIKCYQDDEGNFLILGGVNRWKIAKELNIKTVPVQVYKGTKQEYKELVINDNVRRRHMSKEDKQRVAAELIKINPTRSALSISKEVGISDKTVTSIKNDLKGRSEIPNVGTVDTKGRKQPDKPKRPVKEISKSDIVSPSEKSIPVKSIPVKSTDKKDEMWWTPEMEENKKKIEKLKSVISKKFQYQIDLHEDFIKQCKKAKKEKEQNEGRIMAYQVAISNLKELLNNVLAEVK